MKQKYLTVTALTRYIKLKMDNDPHLNHVLLKGEISNFTHHRSGHMYFSIKDDDAQIRSVMFAGNNRSLKFKPENGMHVIIKGYVSVFEPYGQYQLYVQQMEPDGLGALYMAYEQLKKKLEQKGYFLPERKQSLPKYPEHIGVITSPDGAALRDIMTTLHRRYPIAKMTVIPAAVQGEQAAPSIQAAIDQANNLNLFDVLVITRGGGSIEELWAFNEEIVAEAIFASHLPIVSAVGHETDWTISDYVADLRAPTPTGAIEMIVPSLKELQDRLNQQSRNLQRTMNYQIDSISKQLKRLQQSYAFKYPDQLIKQKVQQLDVLYDRLQQSQSHLFDLSKNKLNYKSQSLRTINLTKMIDHYFKQMEDLRSLNERYMNQIFSQKKQEMKSTLEKLSILNPLAIMKRGYSIIYDADESIVKSIDQVKVADEIAVHLRDGVVESKVLRIKEKNNDE